MDDVDPFTYCWREPDGACPPDASEDDLEAALAAYGWVRTEGSPSGTSAAAAGDLATRGQSAVALEAEPPERAVNAVNLALEAMQRGEV